MSEHYLGTGEVKYIVGRPFTSEDGQHEPGEELAADKAESFHYLEAFVNSGLLYRVTADSGYGALPPHVFNAVITLEEAKAKIAGDDSKLVAQDEWVKSAQLEAAETEAEVQAQLHEQVLAHARGAHEQRGLTNAEKVLEAERQLGEQQGDDKPKKAAKKKD